LKIAARLHEQSEKLFAQNKRGKICLRPATAGRAEGLTTLWRLPAVTAVQAGRKLFSRKAKIISGNFQQRAIFLWLLSFDRSKESNRTQCG